MLGLLTDETGVVGAAVYSKIVMLDSGKELAGDISARPLLIMLDELATVSCLVTLFSSDRPRHLELSG